MEYLFGSDGFLLRKTSFMKEFDKSIQLLFPELENRIANEGNFREI